MDTIEGLVSTIIPVYNRPQMLRTAVESVLAQSWPHREILICDDGSSDDTPELGRALAAAHPAQVRYQWNPNGGAGVAREHGRRQARGEFVQYLDSDDSLWPRKFEVQIAALRKQPDCGTAYGWIRLCPEGGLPATQPHKWSGRAIPTLFPALLVDRWWNTNAPLWRRSVCEAIGPWSDLRYSQDWEYDARAGALGTRLAYCPEFVTDQRHHAENRQTGSGKWLAPSDRVRFFKALHAHAANAGVPSESSEMRHFCRWVFRQARECALLGDDAAAIALCGLVREARNGDSGELVAFRTLAKLLGWKRIAQWSERARGWLGKATSTATQKQSWMS